MDDLITSKFETVAGILFSIQDSFPYVLQLTHVVFYVVGFAIMISALLKARNLSMPGGNVTGFNVAMSMLVAIIIIALPFMIEALANTMYGSLECFRAHLTKQPSATFYDYAAGNDYCGKPNYYAPVLLFVKLVGYISVFRGLLHLKRYSQPGESPDYLSSGFVRIIFGSACIHITQTLYVVSLIFGFRFAAELIGV